MPLMRTTIGLCRNCGHPVSHHGDAAVGACATGVRSALSPFRRVICPCPRYADGEPEFSYLSPVTPYNEDGELVLPGDRPPSLWERLAHLNRG